MLALFLLTFESTLLKIRSPGQKLMATKLNAVKLCESTDSVKKNIKKNLFASFGLL